MKYLVILDSAVFRTDDETFAKSLADDYQVIDVVENIELGGKFGKDIPIAECTKGDFQ